MIWNVIVLCFAVITSGAIGYRLGRLDGFGEGYAAGSPKHGEAAQLRDQVKRLQASLETQCACAATIPEPQRTAPLRDPEGHAYAEMKTPDGIMTVEIQA